MPNKQFGIFPIQEQQQIEAPSAQLVLPYQFTSISKGSTLPSVKNLTRLKFQNSISTNVTDFKDGQEGQEVKFLGDGFTNLIFDPLKLITNTGADKLLDLNSVFSFVRFNGIWIEDSCCDAGSGGGIDGGFPDSIFGAVDGIDGGAP